MKVPALLSAVMSEPQRVRRYTEIYATLRQYSDCTFTQQECLILTKTKFINEDWSCQMFWIHVGSAGTAGCSSWLRLLISKYENNSVSRNHHLVRGDAVTMATEWRVCGITSWHSRARFYLHDRPDPEPRPPLRFPLTPRWWS